MEAVFCKTKEYTIVVQRTVPITLRPSALRPTPSAFSLWFLIEKPPVPVFEDQQGEEFLVSVYAARFVLVH